MRFISFTGEPVTTQLPEPTQLHYADAFDFVAGDVSWAVAFDEHGDAWQVTWIDDPEVESASSRLTLPCFIGPRPR